MSYQSAGMRTFMRLDIRISEILAGQPRMTLSEKVPVTPEFRAEINAWMRQFFGKTENRVISVPAKNEIYMCSEDYAKLKSEINNKYPALNFPLSYGKKYIFSPLIRSIHRLSCDLQTTNNNWR